MQTTTQGMDVAKLSGTHWRVWFLSAMGIFLDGFDLFIIAVALPLIVREFHPSHVLEGLIVSATPLGCILGASVFGRFTDKLGRRVILLLDLLFFVIFAGMSAFAWSIESLIIFRFLLGIGIGADYPVSSTYITENMPKKLRGRMLVSGFGFQALGAFAGAALGGLILLFHPEIVAWRWMLGIAVIPAAIILLLRLTLPESPRWLLQSGQVEKAAEVAQKMTGKKLKVEAMQAAQNSSFLDLFTRRYIKRTLVTSLAWFIMDVAFYGIGFFTPIILTAMAFGIGGKNFISADIASTHGAMLLDIFLIIGIFLAIILVDRWGRMILQSIGFIGMAVGLFILAASHYFSDVHHLFLVFLGFAVFNLLVNMGPNPVTFLLPAEMFPTHIRATGHGFAAASGKVGAAIGGVLIPVMKAWVGLPITLTGIGFLCLLGFILTVTLGYETKGRSLDELERKLEKDMDQAEIGLLNLQRDILRLQSDITHVEGALAKAIEDMRKMHRDSKN